MFDTSSRRRLLTSSALGGLLALSALGATGCADRASDAPTPAADTAPTPVTADVAADSVNPETWPALAPQPLDPAIEERVTQIMTKMTLEQKVGQVIQGDSGTVTPEDVKTYRLGSVLSGGNSAPGPLPYTDTATWLAAADAYFEASLDDEGVEIAIPVIWGIDAVHGHTNLTGAIVFPHNIGLGAARNPDLIEEIARITAHELTVSGHDWTFAPTLAVPQNDRWGRTYEGFSEDPDIVAAYGDRIVYGLQGRPGDDGFMGAGRVISSAKHFLGDGGTEDGVDQGDTNISETELREIHGAGYYTSIPAGVQTVMASFNSWQMRKLHGDKELLTDVLKDRLGFNGFVVGDWNGHGQVPGCTNTDCPQSFNAGVDMYMAPDSWKGLYDSTLRHVQEGTITMERLDDAVRRILRVKIASGIFEKGKPSTRPNAGDVAQLALPAHRAIARQAVRESMVLLKNNDGLLPLEAGATVMVVGDGADSLSKASGGWTLSWQGRGIANSEFPNGQTILSGITEVVEAAGGTVIHSPDGSATEAADVVIAIYGEDPYAEFQGDVPHLDFAPNGFDTETLGELKEKGMPVVSVFLSGRPLWANPEMNDSDAFIAAWLPGSEGGGIADLLFQTDPGYDFTGKLSYSWPAKATDAQIDPKRAPYAPLFALGYGLTYGDTTQVAAFSEESGLSEAYVISSNVFYERGEAVSPWTILLTEAEFSKTADSFPTSISDLIISRADHLAQEDGLRLSRAADTGPQELRLTAPVQMDLTRQSNGAMEMVFAATSFTGPKEVQIGMGCGEDRTCDQYVPMTISADGWADYRVSLSCFADLGADLSTVGTPFIISSQGVMDLGLSHVRLEEDEDGQANCANG